MAVTIDLDPEVEAGYAAQAVARGMSLPEYLRRLLEQQTASIASRPPRQLSPEECAAFWREAVKGLPDTPPLSRAAISRDSIYSGRG